MDGFLLRLTLVCTGAICFILILLPKAVFVIRIHDGKPFLTKGNVPKGFLNDCELLARENDIHILIMKGVKKRNTVFLRFSPSVPQALQQRFRNVWANYA